MEQQGLPQPYRFRDPRQERIYGRLRLIGEGPGEFYRDACRLMDEPGRLAATSHLVSHLMREVDGAVRAVLQVQAEHGSAKSAGRENHKASIASVLKALGVAETNPIAQLWLTLPGDEGLDKKAHRDALFRPRPVDKAFRDFWEQIHVILDFVLERFRDRYLDYHRVLDELAAVETPTGQHAKKLKQRAPNNLVAYRYFFDKITSPLWLRPLAEKGFFKHPPAPEVEEERVRFLPWPQSQYLRRMARHDPRTVADISCRM